MSGRASVLGLGRRLARVLAGAAIGMLLLSLDHALRTADDTLLLASWPAILEFAILTTTFFVGSFFWRRRVFWAVVAVFLLAVHGCGLASFLPSCAVFFGIPVSLWGLDLGMRYASFDVSHHANPMMLLGVVANAVLTGAATAIIAGRLFRR